MIIYRNSVDGFLEAFMNDTIAEDVEEYFIGAMCHRPSRSEKMSWVNSLDKMAKVIMKSKIPRDCGILVEFCLSGSSRSKRIDVILLGRGSDGNDNLIIIELKQWDKADRSFPGVLSVWLASRQRDVLHPSEQALDYKNYMRYMYEAVYDGNISPYSCSYLHNYVLRNPDPLHSEEFREIIEDTPAFTGRDIDRLCEFLKRHVGEGKGLESMYCLENSRIKPSKKLIECVASIFRGNREYVLLDEQRVAYKAILHNAMGGSGKRTIIVNGGPGTGKSVVAVNAMVDLLKAGANVRFVAPNAAFRNAIVNSLTEGGYGNANHVKMLFTGSSSFFESPENEFDAVVVDEAHRLKKKGAYMYKGESQVEDVIGAARVSVFFVDDSQMIRPSDEGTMARIREAAKKLGSEVYEVQLDTQYRCSGAEDYVEWVTDTLGIPGAGFYSDWTSSDYIFRIMDNPKELADEIFALQEEGFKARILAGYAWEWTSVRDGNPDAEVPDVRIGGDFALPWNSRAKQTDWAFDPSCSRQVGCVHTSQGLEFDYVGVLVGKDLTLGPDGELAADISNYHDREGKKGLKDDPETLTRFIKNVYRVLMTRGMKGCFIYFEDTLVKEHFGKALSLL